MAWSDLTDDQMVSFTDAQTSPFTIDYCQNQITSNKCMDVSDISTKYGLSAPAGYSSNRLVPKGLWSSNFYDTLQYYRKWTGMTVDSNGDVYACTTFPGDIYKLNKSGTPPNFNRLIADDEVVFRGMTTDTNGNVWACVDNGDIYKTTLCRNGLEHTLEPIGGTNRGWTAMTSGAGGSVYACVNNGDIYKRTGPSDVFLPLGQTSRYWRSMTIDNDGNVWACVDNGDIYKQTAGGGNFVAQYQGNRRWIAMTTAPNGDVYAAVYGGSIYIKFSYAENFYPVPESEWDWYAITAASNGDIYACSYVGELYKRTGGVGDFQFIMKNVIGRNVVAMDYDSFGNIFLLQTRYYDGGWLWGTEFIESIIHITRTGIGEFLPTGQTDREWSGMTSDNFGAVWACVWNGGIYKKLDPGGVFTSSGLTNTNRQWTGMTVDNSGNVWACVYDGDIYKSVGGVGNFTAQYQGNRRWKAMATAVNGNVYACTEKVGNTYGRIYQYNPGTNNFVDLAVEGNFAGLAGTPDGNMWAITQDGTYAKLSGSIGNNFVYVGYTVDVSGLCSSTHPSTDGTLYAYKRDYWILKNPKPGTTSTPQYFNTEQSGTTTRDTCPPNYTPGEATLVVPANTYMSTVSIANANQLALNYIFDNIQEYANANGSCTAPTVYYNTEQSATAARNNCPSGYTAGDATLTVAANTYSSYASVAVANQLALDYIYDNLQDYANANGSCTAPVYYNTQQSGTATRDNCTEGYGGTTVTLTVAANTYSSSVSIADANNQAIAYIDANKQAYANANGSCTSICTSYRHIASADSTIYWTSCNGLSKSKATSRFGSYTICALTGTYSGGSGQWTNLGACTSSTIYYNTQQSGTATRNNCPEGYTAGTATLTVAADTFSSLISVADANSQAVAYINANKQDYANANGSCTAPTVYYNTEQSTTATKNDCPPGYTGNTVEIVISANEYSSLVSVEDANNQVIIYLDANKQSIANAEGSCSQNPPSVTYDYYGNLSYNDPCQGSANYYIGSDDQWYEGDGTNFTEVTGTFVTMYDYYDPGWDQYYYSIYNLAYGGTLTYWGTTTSQCEPYQSN
jgi:hypothetical protein